MKHVITVAAASTVLAVAPQILGGA